MLYRIDLPSQASAFSNDYEGNQPYNSKYSKPISKIVFTDTPFMVNSYGLTATWYNDASDESLYISTSFTGIIPGGLLKFWWDYGVPEQISDSEVTKWGVKFSGYFYPEYSGNYKFYIYGHGQLNELSIDGSEIASDNTLNINKSGYVESDAVTLTAGEWVDFTLRYCKTISQDKFAGLTCLCRYIENDTTMPEKIVLCPGITAPDGNSPDNNSMPIESTAIKYYDDVSVDYDEFGAKTFKFTVPFISDDTSYNFRGFYKSGIYEFTDIENTAVVLKQFRKIDYYEGYENTSGVQQMVHKFSGHIRIFDIDYASKGNDKVTITCISPIIFTKDQFIEYVPNPIDYACAEYLEEVPGYVNGLVKPRCFDGWEVSKVFKNLLLNSFVDPTLFYKKKEFVNYSGQLTDGGYLIDYTSTATRLYLPTQKNYGNIANVLGETQVQVDDEYVYTAETGEYIYDVINKMIEPFSFKWGFTEKGYPFMGGVDVPTRIYDNTDFTAVYGTFTSTVDMDCVRATYSRTSNNVAQGWINGYGSRIDLIMRVGPSAGTEENNLNVLVRKGGGGSGPTIINKNISTYYSTTWSYYDGPDSDGVNPCIFNIGTGLSYGLYSIYLIKTTSTGYIDLDAAFYYDVDINTPSFSFYTGDSVDNGQIVSLNSYETGDDIRNTGVVIGKRTGTRLTYVSENVSGAINPNNPVWTYYSSKVIDLYSLSSPSAANFAGRPLKTIIVEPDITSQRQADFIAFNFVNENRLSHQELKFETIGNPMMQVGDCIYVIDSEKNGTSTSKKMWITLIESSNTNGGYLTRFDCVDVKPLQSFYQKPQPDLDTIGSPIRNVRIFNGGAIGTLLNPISDTDTELIMVPVTGGNISNVPSKGYLKLTNDTDYEIVKYTWVEEVTGSNIQYHDLTRGLQGSIALSWSGGDNVIGAWDQYTQDGISITPIIMFDLLVDAKVEITINGKPSTGEETLVARLTNQHADYYPYDGYNEVTWGQDQYFTWNGCDDVGYWNSMYNYDLPSGIRGGVFAVEPYDANTGISDYSEFHIKIVIEYAGGKYEYPSDLSDELQAGVPKIYTRRGPVSSAVSFQIVYDNTYYINTFGEETFYETDPQINYPTKFYIKTDANGGKMIKYKMIDTLSDYTSDNDFTRLYQLHISANLDKYFGMDLSDKDEGHTREVSWENYSVVLIDDQDFTTNLYNDGNGYIKYFSPEDPKQTKDTIFTFFPNGEHMSFFREKYRSYIGNGDKYTIDRSFVLMPYLYFTGYILDKSGRKAGLETWDVDDQYTYFDGLFNQGGHPIAPVGQDVGDSIMWYKTTNIVNLARRDVPFRAIDDDAWVASHVVGDLRESSFTHGPRKPMMLAIIYDCDDIF